MVRRLALAVALGSAPTGLAAAQGPGSCGFHLDVLADSTSTHSALADVPGAPGGIPDVGLPAGSPGNPYTAYATPGTVVTLRLTVPAGTLGPAPLGAGSVVSIAWSLGTADLGLAPGPAGVPPCVPGQPWVVSVLPFGGTVVDGLGFLGPAPLVAPVDPGHPGALELPVLYPAFAPAPVLLQAALLTPAGLLAVSNGVSILPAPSPYEISLLPALLPCDPPGPLLDDGFVPMPLPAGFTFYGAPVGEAFVSTNGYLLLASYYTGTTATCLEPGPPPCDFAGDPGDLGCFPASATEDARIAVNHYDGSFLVPPPAPLLADLTCELVFGTTVDRFIVRWKHLPSFGSLPASPATNHASMVCELWGGTGDFPSRIAVVRQRIHGPTGPLVHELVGIGPGDGPCFGGPPPACLGLPLAPLYGGPPLFAGPADAIFMEAAPAPAGVLDSLELGSLAVVFDPLGFGFPDAYSVAVY